MNKNKKKIPSMQEVAQSKLNSLTSTIFFNPRLSYFQNSLDLDQDPQSVIVQIIMMCNTLRYIICFITVCEHSILTLNIMNTLYTTHSSIFPKQTCSMYLQA